MARAYANRYLGGPLYTIEETVGIGMRNARTDVKLVQILLKAIVESRKIYISQTFTPPDAGPPLVINGVWDEASKRYLSRWEEIQGRVATDWNLTAPQFLGTVVPYVQGGKKIISMNEQSRTFFGEDAHRALDLPGVKLDDDLKADLFW